MYGVTRATLTLIGVIVAGFLLWLGVQIIDPLDESVGQLSNGDYWTWMATLAGAGVAIALSQLLGGWTKWGWPRVSMPVLFVGFLPGLAAGLWVLLFHQPGGNWFSDHTRSWSDDLGIETLVAELGLAVPVIGFGLGLLFGLTFDTTGPRLRREAIVEEHAGPVVPEGPPVAGAGYAEQAVPEGHVSDVRSAPEPEARVVRDDEPDLQVERDDGDYEPETRTVRPDDPPRRTE